VEVGSKALAQVLALAAYKDATTIAGRQRTGVRGEASALKDEGFAAREERAHRTLPPGP